MKAGEKHRARHKGAGPPALPAAAPEILITCPACGAETDLWTGGEETRCEVCDQELYKKQRKDH